MKSNEPKLNENISQILAQDLHLTVQEKNIKDEMERLFTETNNVAEQLKAKGAEVEVFCFDHFAKIMNSIDLQREELKQKLDDIAESLLKRVKECKSKFESDIKLNISTTKATIDETEDLEKRFCEELREIRIDEETMNGIKTSLSSNLNALNTNMDSIESIRTNMESCVMAIEKISLDSDVFGELKLSDEDSLFQHITA